MGKTEELDEEGRLIMLEYDAFLLINVYVSLLLQGVLDRTIVPSAHLSYVTLSIGESSVSPADTECWGGAQEAGL